VRGTCFCPGRWDGNAHIHDGSRGKLHRQLMVASGTSGWSAHDLRRTFRSNLARLGVSRELAEVLLNHAPGVPDEIHDRYDRIAEKRLALEKLEAHILSAGGVLTMAEKPNFEQLIQAERERLQRQREDAEERLQATRQEIGSIDRELAAISAYDAARKGERPATAAPAPPRQRKPRASSGQRAPRGERREALLTLLRQRSGGMTRGEIIEAMQIKGNKQAEQSVSNALTLMKKAGQVRSGDDGKYMVA
jgi:hypothetical protein